MDENSECYYNRMPTEDLQKCVDHVIANHGDKVLKLRATILNENTRKHLKNNNFGFIPTDKLGELYAGVFQ